MPTAISHFIGGRTVAGTSTRTAPVYNPATGAVSYTHLTLPTNREV